MFRNIGWCVVKDVRIVVYVYLYIRFRLLVQGLFVLVKINDKISKSIAFQINIHDGLGPLIESSF